MFNSSVIEPVQVYTSITIDYVMFNKNPSLVFSKLSCLRIELGGAGWGVRRGAGRPASMVGVWAGLSGQIPLLLPRSQSRASLVRQ